MHRQSVAQLLVCLLVCLLPSIDGSTAREDYVATCGWGWQERYMQLHADTVAGKRDGKFVVAIPVKAGLADVIHGYISAFLFALLTDRAFLILRVPRLDDNTQRSVEFAYTAPFFVITLLILQLYFTSLYFTLLPFTLPFFRIGKRLVWLQK